VLLINDLIPVRFAATLGSAENTELFERIRRSAEWCERILTISQASKQDIIYYWKIPEEKIAVVPLAVSDVFKTTAVQSGDGWRQEADMVLGRFKITAPYILSVCNVSPRKNLERLLQAYELIRTRRKLNLQLVVTGMRDKNYEEFGRQLSSSPYKQDVIVTGFVPDAELAVLYRNALLFAFPSLYEGFGLPVLEAMSCGAPVVTSMVSSMPEVGGDCAVYCDPHSVESISQALETVLDDDEKRCGMSRMGMERAGSFNWAATAAVIRRNLLQLM
jgi:glycosyltransferase involved in cell wall biosynthesis